MRLTLALLSAMALQTALAEDSFQTYSGFASELKGSSKLYDEHHYLRFSERKLVERVVLYSCPGGKPFARKRMRIGDAQQTPSFEMSDARIGYVEGVQQQSSGFDVYFKAGTNAEQEQARVDNSGSLVIDAGFDEFVRANWERMLAGDKVRFDFMVPSRLEAISFKVAFLRSEPEDGVPAQVFRLSLSGVLGWIVSGIDVWYDAKSKRLLRFDGLSNVRNEEGDNYKASIRFPATAMRSESDAQVFTAATQVPLVSSCP
jgi:hypothetical protein